jgi:hypothetical protein
LGQNLNGRFESIVGSTTDGKEQVIDDPFDFLTHIGAARAQHAIFDAAS